MKTALILPFLIVFFCNALEVSAQYGFPKYTESYITHFYQEDLEIDFELTLQDPTANAYSLRWMVLSTSKRQLGENQELHCFIWDGDSLIWESNGLNIPRHACSFISQNKSVKVIFEVRNKMVHQPAIRPDENATIRRISIQPITSIQHLQFNLCDESEYQPMRVKLTPYNRWITTLKNNQRIVQLDYSKKGMMFLDEMPQLGCNYQMVLCLDRYYINIKTGKILPGRRWLARKSVQNILRKTELVLLHPLVIYTTYANLKIPGKSLMKKARLNMADFQLTQFYASYPKAPY